MITWLRKLDSNQTLHFRARGMNPVRQPLLDSAMDSVEKMIGFTPIRTTQHSECHTVVPFGLARRQLLPFVPGPYDLRSPVCLFPPR